MTALDERPLIAAADIVGGLPLQPPRLSLASMAVPGDQVDALSQGVAVGNRWENGMQWWPMPCGGLYGYDDCTPAGPSGSLVTLQASNVPGIRSYKPPVLEAKFSCSTLGMHFDWYRERASALLNAMAPKGIGMEFFSGPITRATATGNPYLTEHGLATDLSGGTAVDIKRGLAILEQFIADNIGTRGMIHVQPELVPQFGVRRDGPYLLTNQDTIMVPDYGYNGYGPETSLGDGGTAPAAGSTWAYATGLVVVRQSEDALYPDNGYDLQQQLREAVRRSDNTAVLSASRYVAATVDACAIGAVRITLDS